MNTNPIRPWKKPTEQYIRTLKHVLGRTIWPTEISKTITLEDNGVAWTYRRKVRKLKRYQTKEIKNGE